MRIPGQDDRPRCRARRARPIAARNPVAKADRGRHEVLLRPAARHRARHRLVEGLRDDRHARCRRAAARPRHRPARKPRGQARLHRRHGSERGRDPRGGRAGRADGGRDHRRRLGGYRAGGLVSDLANVEVEIGGHQIEQSDIDELLAAGRGAIDRGGQVVLHAHPALYTIDGVEGVKKPLGLHADKLGVDIHVIAADPSPVRNLDFVRPLGASRRPGDRRLAGRGRAGLPERGGARARRRAGRAWRRASPTSRFAGGMLVGLRSIPIGAKDITDDIASAFAARGARPSGSNASTARR